MKCSKCGIVLSDKVCRIHEARCTINEATLIKIKPIAPTEKNVTPTDYKELELENPVKYTLEDLLQMCIDNQDINYSPSTIKRWKEERCLKELNL